MERQYDNKWRQLFIDNVTEKKRHVDAKPINKKIAHFRVTKKSRRFIRASINFINCSSIQGSHTNDLMITQDADTPGHSPIPCIVPSGQERRQHAAERESTSHLSSRRWNRNRRISPTRNNRHDWIKQCDDAIKTEYSYARYFCVFADAKPTQSSSSSETVSRIRRSFILGTLKEKIGWSHVVAFLISCYRKLKMLPYFTI